MDSFSTNKRWEWKQRVKKAQASRGTGDRGEVWSMKKLPQKKKELVRNRAAKKERKEGKPSWG